MSDEREEVLEEEIKKLEEQTKVLGEKMEELLGVDCSFGACVFDPEVSSVEAKLEELQKRKEALESILNHLESR